MSLVGAGAEAKLTVGAAVEETLAEPTAEEASVGAKTEAWLAAAASGGGARARLTSSSAAGASSTTASSCATASAGMAPAPASPPAAMALHSQAEAPTPVAFPRPLVLDRVADPVLDGAALSPHTAAFVSRAFAAREAQAVQDAVDMDLRSAAYGQAAGAEAAK